MFLCICTLEVLMLNRCSLRLVQKFLSAWTSLLAKIIKYSTNLILTPVFEESPPPPNILVFEVPRSTLGKIPPNLLEISYGKINI